MCMGWVTEDDEVWQGASWEVRGLHKELETEWQVVVGVLGVRMEQLDRGGSQRHETAGLGPKRAGCLVPGTALGGIVTDPVVELGAPASVQISTTDQVPAEASLRYGTALVSQRALGTWHRTR